MLMLMVMMGIIFIITTRYMKYKAIQLNNAMMRNVNSIKIQNQMLKIETKYWKLNSQGELNEYPRISRYLEQNSNCLNQMDDKFDLSKIIITEAKYDVEFKKFIKELRRAPKVVQDLVLDKANVLEQIIKLNRPYYYMYLNFKSTVQSNIAKVLINGLMFLVKAVKNTDRTQSMSIESEKILYETNKIRKTTAKVEYA